MVKKEKTLTDIIDYFTNGYGDSLPSHSTIRKWAAHFQPGQQSLDDDPGEGRPSLAIIDENVRAVDMWIMADRRVTSADSRRLGNLVRIGFNHCS